RTGKIQGFTWLPNGSALLYSSSAGSTMLYPPVFNLRTISKDGGMDRQITFGDASYVEPDMVVFGNMFASRVRIQSDIFRFPIDGTPSENIRNRFQVTHQTGQVQVPYPSPDGTEVAYISDSGGHSNVWVAKVDGSAPARRLTFEQDSDVRIGIATWSPTDSK